MRKSRILAIGVVAAFALLGGCFPIELDVQDGKLLISRGEGFFIFDPATGKATKVGAAEGGKPVFARFAPGGKEVLTVTSLSEGFNDFSFAIVPRAGGPARQIHKGKNAAYVLFSPDGAQVAITQVVDKEDPQLKTQLPELVVVPTAGGPAKTLLGNVGATFRWFKDSKRLLVFQINKKDEEQSRFYGTLLSLEVATGKTTPLAQAAVAQKGYFDLSPDGTKVLMVALACDKPGTDVSKTADSSTRLYELDLTSGGIRKIDKDAQYAIYSPSGKQVLLGTPPPGFSFEGLSLEIADAALTKFTSIATDAYQPMSMGGGGGVFPGWIDEKTVFYFVEKPVYGTEGKAIHLYSVGVDGKSKTSLQPQIDMEVVKASGG